MDKKAKYKCQGCNRMIVPVPRRKRRKFHDYACFARSQAKHWGLTPKQIKAISDKRDQRLALALKMAPVGD